MHQRQLILQAKCITSKDATDTLKSPKHTVSAGISSQEHCPNELHNGNQLTLPCIQRRTGHQSADVHRVVDVCAVQSKGLWLLHDLCQALLMQQVDGTPSVVDELGESDAAVYFLPQQIWRRVSQLTQLGQLHAANTLHTVDSSTHLPVGIRSQLLLHICALNYTFGYTFGSLRSIAEPA